MSLRGQRVKKRKHQTRGYAQFHAVGWHNEAPKTFMFPWKALLLLGLAVALVLGPTYVYYLVNVASNIPGPTGPNPNYDPFTLLWNGTASSASAHYDQSTQKDQCIAGCSSASISTSANDTIMLHTECWSTAGTDVGTPTDSLSTVYTRIVSQIFGGVDSVWAGNSTGGNDVVTVPLNTCTNFSFSVDVYSLVTHIGANNKDTGASANAAGSDTLTMTVKGNSIIYEGWSLSNANANCPTESAGSGQTIRDTFTCFVFGGNRIDGVTMDKGIGAAGSIGSVANWANGGGGVTWSHLGVELVSNAGCPAGYRCLFSTTDSNGNVQLNAKPIGPSTLDRFHPTPDFLFGTGNVSQTP
jgi:hypothetical protein